ncbi:MAG: nucleoside hydrolase [Clostridia bacterium]
MRRLLIDTDTGSDDVWAIIAALRAVADIHVEAITVVCGNVALDRCVENALIAVEVAGTYAPPVYRGMARPLLKEKLFTSEFVHGSDGLSEMNLPPPEIQARKEHAMDAIIALVMENPGQIEIVTLGPLTNLAMAYLKEPKIAENIKKVFIMGGAGADQGNATPAAEFNVYVDAEAADIVLKSGMEMLWVTWDTCRGETSITREDLAVLTGMGSSIADFCVRCTASLRAYEYKKYNNTFYGVIDSVIMIALLHPEIMQNVYAAYCTIELRGELTYGHFSIDKQGQLHQPSNATICSSVDAAAYKRYLFQLLSE